MAKDYEDRRRARQMMVVHACMIISEKLGDQSPKDAASEIRVSAVAAIAEARSVWEFLLARGLATEEQRQDALDRAYRGLLGQVETKGMEISAHGRLDG